MDNKDFLSQVNKFIEEKDRRIEELEELLTDSSSYISELEDKLSKEYEGANKNARECNGDRCGMELER